MHMGSLSNFPACCGQLKYPPNFYLDQILHTYILILTSHWYEQKRWQGFAKVTELYI